MFGFLSLPLSWKNFLPFSVGQPFTGETQEVRDTWRLKDGTAVTLRATRSDDGPLIQALVQGLSLRSRYQRFFYPLRELPPGMLERFTHNDPQQAMTLLAVVQRDGRETAIAMAQYVADPYPQRCDFAVLVDDAWQRNGLGRRLVETVTCLARAAGLERIEGDVLAENDGMIRMMLAMGFHVARHADGAYLLKASKRLAAVEAKCSPLVALATTRRPQQEMAVRAA
jgi:GNAT superfamily N-acetyltransferase